MLGLAIQNLRCPICQGNPDILTLREFMTAASVGIPFERSQP
jgi:hypothetical protein